MHISTTLSPHRNTIHDRMDQECLAIPSACPYGQPFPALYLLTRSHIFSDEAMAVLLASGFRRNGNYFYKMQCQGCKACIPIRLRPEQFAPSRSQKRVLKKNADIEVRLGPLTMDDESLDLLTRFLRKRYPNPSSTAEGYYSGFFLNIFCQTVAIQYRHENKLTGISIVDIGSNWLNAVYHFFDPEKHRHSIGTYNILHLINLCRHFSIDYLYLGYLIREVSAMNYKENFKPHELLVNEKWQPGQRS